MILGGVSVVGQVPAGYYDGASGLSGAPLKSALSHIIRGHTKVSYDNLWTAFIPRMISRMGRCGTFIVMCRMVR